jgi:hypothetical protein
MIRYAVVPDYVISKSDGEKHWISASALVRLYNLPLGSYWIFSGDERLDTSLIKLTVRFHGDYQEHFEKVRDNV